MDKHTRRFVFGTSPAFFYAFEIVLSFSILTGQTLAVSSCSAPILAPEAYAEIVSSRGEENSGEAAVVVSVRIMVKGSLAVERFGITVKVKTGLRDYWHTEVLNERIPPGGSVVLDVKTIFGSADERYAERSAAIESAWFE